MKIREAKTTDKKIILKFCKNTFSWGDYIEDIWDYWIKEKNLFVIQQEIPLGLCHAFFSNDQVWIEGIRINPSFRKLGLASKLISHVESIASKKNIHSSLMLIDTENKISLSMAENLNYKVLETWKFYSLLPQSNENFNINFGKISNISFPHYVLSWRWLPLDKKILKSLETENKIILSDLDGKQAVVILTDSEHFEKTLTVTFWGGSKKNNLNLISFLQNFGFTNNYKRIQILTKESLSEFETLECKISFYLMKKILI